MKIINRLEETLETATTIDVPTLTSDGARSTRQATIQVEHLLDLFINEVHTMRIVCTPDHLIELAIGRMLTEGIIESLDDIETLYLCEHGSYIRVFLSNRQADFSQRPELTVQSCCTGNITFNRYFIEQDTPAPVAPIRWEPDWVFELARAFAEGSPLHRATGGAHSFRLRTPDGAIRCFEDLGRHNALDKAMGWALLNEVPLAECIAYSSGRIPVDMTLKAIRSRVPILATKSVPTTSAIEIARTYGLTLLCNVRPDSMDVACDPFWQVNGCDSV